MQRLPNLLTLVRLGLVPVMAYFLAGESYAAALAVFLMAAVSDAADGYIARRLPLVSRLGTMLDPIADKLNMLVATVLLAWLGALPIVLAIAIVLRDAVIVAGAAAYRWMLGHVEIAPTRLSKANTFLEFAMLLAIMAVGAGWLRPGGWMRALFAIVLVTVVASGAQSVWLWGRKALRERA